MPLTRGNYEIMVKLLVEHSIQTWA